MRILTKIILSIVVLILATISQAIITETGVGLKIIPGAIAVFGLIGVWRYKPNKSKDTDLDKTL